MWVSWKFFHLPEALFQMNTSFFHVVLFSLLGNICTVHIGSSSRSTGPGMEAALMTSVLQRLTLFLWPCHLWINAGQGSFLPHGKSLLTFLWCCCNENNCVPSASWFLWIFMWELPVITSVSVGMHNCRPPHTTDESTVLPPSEPFNSQHFFRIPWSLCVSHF